MPGQGSVKIETWASFAAKHRSKRAGTGSGPVADMPVKT